MTTEKSRTKLSPQVQTARNWYIWLWLSPLLTVPTWYFLLTSIAFFTYDPSFPDKLTNPALALPVLGSALWHLVLLIPAIGGASEFVRWHGRQALLLAGLRTVTMLAITFSPMLASPWEDLTLTLGILVFLAVWLIGNIWGQRQARGGECSLMRWTGHGASLPMQIYQAGAALATPSTSPSSDSKASADVDSLVETIRFDPDPEKRRAALAELEQLGFVEPLS